MSTHHHIDADLLGKYLAGEASPEEALAIDDWISGSVENRRFFEEVSLIWDQSSPERRYRLANKEDAWQEIRNRFNESGPPANSPLSRTITPVSPIRRKTYRLRTAAILLLLMAGALSVFLYKERNAQPSSTPFITRQTGENIFRDTLPDHSILVLNTHSTIRYPGGAAYRDQALQLSGEAWFDIRTDPARPFTIRVGDILVKVLGTSFNIRQDQAAIEIAVSAGTIRMADETDSLTVKAGHKGVYSIPDRRLYLVDSFDVNTMAYATRVFDFENVSLKQIAAQLEKAYGIIVVFRNKKLESCPMSSSFENRSVNYIFDVISATLNVSCAIDGKTVYISGKGCD